ncbi:uncharacterized protein LOC144108697 isoform X1 [Amblyomma americanum]
MAHTPNSREKLEKLEKLQQTIALLKYFDKYMENIEKLLEDTHGDINQSIVSELQWAQSDSTILHTEDLPLRGDERGPCSDQDMDPALEYIAATLGMEPMNPSAHLSKSDSSSAFTSSKFRAQALSGFGDTTDSDTTLKPGACGEMTVRQDERGTLDAKLVRTEAAARCAQEACQNLCVAELDEDEEDTATDPHQSATSYWMQLTTVLGSDSMEKNPNESVNLSVLSISDCSHDEGSFSAYKDALDQHTQNQQLSRMSHRELRARRKQDIRFLDEVIGHLAAKNQELIREREKNRVQGKNLAIRKIKLLKAELQWLEKAMQNDSETARAFLHAANMSAAAESTAAEGTSVGPSGMAAVLESCRNAIFQEYCSSLDRIMKDEDKARPKRVRQERRVAKAEKLLSKAEKTFHENNPIAGTLQILETIKELRSWEKAIPFVEGKVDGRTFAEWLPVILPFIGKRH